MTPDEQRRLYYAALARAPYGGETREVSMLRSFTHREFLAGRIDAGSQDQIGRLIDAIAVQGFSKVGDIIGPNATDIAWDVLMVKDCQGDEWVRAFGDNRYAIDDSTGERDRSQEYDWFTEGGWAGTAGLLDYAPLLVTVVASLPEVDA